MTHSVSFHTFWCFLRKKNCWIWLWKIVLMSIDLYEWFFSMLNLDRDFDLNMLNLDLSILNLEERRWIAAIFSALLFIWRRSLFSSNNLSLKAICELATLNNKRTAINNILQLNFFLAFLATQKWQLLSILHPPIHIFKYLIIIIIIVSISHRKTCHTYMCFPLGNAVISLTKIATLRFFRLYNKTNIWKKKNRSQDETYLFN